MMTFSQYIKKKYDADVHIDHRKRPEIRLHHLSVPKHKQGEGIGSKVMTDLNHISDKLKKKVTLSPASKDKHFGTTSRSRLVKFYKSHGYKENKGRNTDYSMRAGDMYREPTRKKK